MRHLRCVRLRGLREVRRAGFRASAEGSEALCELPEESSCLIERKRARQGRRKPEGGRHCLALSFSSAPEMSKAGALWVRENAGLLSQEKGSTPSGVPTLSGATDTRSTALRASSR